MSLDPRSPPPPTGPPPACPRCAYDLSGEVARWTDRCPTTGTCPECGLTLEWSGVINPTRFLVPGFVEHISGPLRTIAAAWRTWWWTRWPHLFWSRISLETPIRPRRWLVWLLIIFVGGKLVASGIYAAADLLEYQKQTKNLSELFVLVGDGAINTFFRGIADVYVFHRPGRGVGGSGYVLDWRWQPVPSFLRQLSLLVFLPLVVLLLLPETRRVSKVQAGHVWRAWIYSLAWLALPVLLDVLNALRVFTRTKTGTLILESFMPMPRSLPDWPRAITDQGMVIAGVLLAPLAAWLTLWWWHAIESWRLAEARRVMATLAIIWALALAVVLLPPALEWVLQR